SRSGGGLMKNAPMIGAVVALILSVVALMQMNARVSSVEKSLEDQEAKLEKRMASVETSNRATSEALANKLGMTEKELEVKAAELQRSQKESEARISRTQEAKLTEATGAIRSDIGTVKTEVAATKEDLASTKAKLEQVKGALGIQGGLIARTASDLEELKRKGDRNYYEFALQKGKDPTPVSTVSLQLKKVDSKKNKFNLMVMADDRQIEKKDKTIFEPLQFYT